MHDRRVIEERQLGRVVPGLFSVSEARCKHGYPQAYVTYPVNNAGGISSGMIRLSCPHLVKEIDLIESKGAIEQMDLNLANSADGGPQLQANFAATNKAWRLIRNSAVTQEDREFMGKALGTEGAANLMESGIIGCMNTEQTKCLHAHTADQLLRGTNTIGAYALSTLESQGVDPAGCADCWQQCDVAHVPSESSWWYVPTKNKHRLSTAKATRRMNKARRHANLSREEEEHQKIS